MDARSLAVEAASTILLSSGERMDGLGSKWVMWRLPGNREKEKFWNHAIGKSAAQEAVVTPVLVHAWNGNKKVPKNAFYFKLFLKAFYSQQLWS